MQLLEVGPLCHSRWLTLDCRILRYYVSQDKPNLTLVLLTEFRIKEYFPNFFEVEAKNSITDAPRNLFFKLRRVTQFPDKQVRDIAHKVLRHNAHAEHVITAMPGNENKPVRDIAVNKIMSLCETLTAGHTDNFKKQAARKYIYKSCEEVQGSIHKPKCNIVSPAS